MTLCKLLQMVLAWEANMTVAQRKTLTTLYSKPNLKLSDEINIKMMQLITKSKALGTVNSYATVINKWKTFCDGNQFQKSPARPEHVARFISSLAVKQESLSTFLKLSPALTFYHEAHGFTTTPAVSEPFIRLLLTGAKREASERKCKVKKADIVSSEVVHEIIDKVLWKHGVGTVGTDPNLADWRTVVRLYTYYKSFCRFDCYSQLTLSDIDFTEDYVQITFVRAKNNQFYSGSYCLLSNLPDSPYCPRLVFKSYFSVMKFTGTGVEYLNCRILNSRILSAKPTEKLSYTSSLESSKKLLASMGLEGNFSEKSFKSSGVSEAIEKEVPLIDVQRHGRWKSLETPLIYDSRSKRRRLAVSKVVI